MDSKSLMIGDWVNVRGRFVYAIENGNASCGKITDFETRAKKINCLTDKAIYVDAHTDGEIAFEPIPLTPEILEKNGIKFQYGSPWYQWHDGRLQIVYDDVRLCVDYVHTLQHLLRLCGLDELADNFKI